MLNIYDLERLGELRQEEWRQEAARGRVVAPLTPATPLNAALRARIATALMLLAGWIAPPARPAAATHRRAVCATC